MREVGGLSFLILTGQALPIWAASLLAFVLTFGLLMLRFRHDRRRPMHFRR